MERLTSAENRRFAVTVDGFKTVMSSILAERCKGWKNDVLSDDSIRSFCARNSDLTYRNCKNKDTAKVEVQNYYHFKRYFFILTELNRTHPGTMLNGDRIWNVDETSVDSNFGGRVKDL